jgi:hypothetical protein
MPGFFVLADFALAYASLSRDGRAFLRKQRSGQKAGRTSESAELLRIRPSRLSLIRSLKTCDAVFTDVVPESMRAASGRPASSLYPRFVPFAWISLELWTRLLAAHGISPDEDDARLLILLTFVHREWNDLADEFPAEVLYRSLRSGDSPEPRLRLLGHLTALNNALAERKGRFNKLFQVWQKSMAFYGRPFKPEEAASYLEGKAALNEESYAAAVLPEVPPDLAETLRRLYIWFLALDDAADVERDRTRGRSTFMTLAADPIGEIWGFFRTCEEEIRRTSPRDPGPLLLLMRSMTADVAAAIRRGRDIEGDFYAAPAEPVNRISDPSSPYKEGRA